MSLIALLIPEIVEVVKLFKEWPIKAHSDISGVIASGFKLPQRRFDLTCPFDLYVVRIHYLVRPRARRFDASIFLQCVLISGNLFLDD